MRLFLVADDRYWQIRARLKRDLFAREPINDARHQIANRDSLSSPFHSQVSDR